MTEQDLIDTIRKTAEQGSSSLYLDHKGIQSLPPEIGQLTSLRKLRLSGNKLTSLPSEISALANLEELHLSFNRLVAVPREIGQLRKLRHLVLTGNELRSLPQELTGLTDLRGLALGNNRLSSLPKGIADLCNLSILQLENNQFTLLPTEIGYLKLERLTIDGNPLTSPPTEIVSTGAPSVMAFLRNVHESNSERFEAKVLVLGQGGVGKSSIVRRLLQKDFQNLDTTLGVEVAHLDIPHPTRADFALQLNIWDFAGQEIEHATHQFFMSPKAVYLLVWNSRNGHAQGKLNYWLELIQSRAPKAPILLVATHTDQRSPDVNYAALQKTHPKLVGQHAVDNRSANGIAELRNSIAQAAASLPLMGQRWPDRWTKVEQSLKELDEHHVSYRRFVDICRMHELDDETDASALAETLHHLGVILHFSDDAALQDFVVLKPNWITKAISYALTDQATEQSFGRLRHVDLPRIWRGYAQPLYPAFFRLMSRFELCYKLESNEAQSLIPALLPFTPPSLPDLTPKLQAVYRLGSIPAGLMSRFIVRTHRFTRNTHWRDGAFLGYDGQRARVEIFEHLREVQISVVGSSPTNFFAVLIDTLDQILEDFPGLRVEKLIPCICAGPERRSPCGYMFLYQDLVRYRESKRSTIECRATLRDVSINELLFGIHESARSDILDEVRDARTQATEKYRQLVLLGQRSIVMSYNDIEARDIGCPSIFLLSPSGESEMHLQLLCQSTEGWHLASTAARYPITDSHDNRRFLAPLLRETIILLEHVVPLRGLDIKLSSFVARDERAFFRRDLDLMRQIVQSTEPARGRVAGIQEALRQFRYFLGSLDPARVYGGLRMAQAPTGDRIWLCPFHCGELTPPALQVDSPSLFDAFVCHNSLEKQMVRQIASMLSTLGVRCWLDEEQLIAGERWQEGLARGLRDSASTVVCIGEHGLGDWQMEELAVALSQSVSNKRRRVIPVLLPPLTELPAEAPAFLRGRHAVTLRSHTDTECIQALARGIRHA